ncbi:MAG: hypothetical protein IT458_10740 [Planctomycetes bacterium]|nr:hypothetical protein [Planctomycetota bacterium]
MFKIVKWVAIAGVITAGGAFFVFGPHATSYFRTMAGSIRDGVRGSVPVDFELKRAEELIQAISPEIDNCKRDVARAEVELENLVQDVQRLENEVGKAEKKLRTSSLVVSPSGCGEQTTALVLASHGVARRRVEIDLERTFEVYKNNQALLKGKKALIERQNQAVSAARTRLDAVRAEKSRLEDMVATLKTQKAQLDALAAGSRRFDLDDSNLGKAKEVLAEVKKRLDVAQRMLEDDAFYAGGTEDAAASDRNIVAEIQTWFAEQERSGSEGTAVKVAERR